MCVYVTFPLVDGQLHVLEALVVGHRHRLVGGVRVLRQVLVSQRLFCRYTSGNIQHNRIDAGYDMLWWSRKFQVNRSYNAYVNL